MKKPKLSISIKFAFGALCLVLVFPVLFCLAFPLFRYHLNHRGIAPDLINPPPEITRIIRLYNPSDSTSLSPNPPAINAQTSATLTAYVEKLDFFSYRMALDSENPGAALALRIKGKLDRLEQETTSIIFPNLAFRPEDVWDPATSAVTAEQARWLEAHQDLIHFINQYCQTDGPTPPTIDECLRFEKEHPQCLPDTYWLFFNLGMGQLLNECASLISATGMEALQKEDFAHAQHYYRDLTKLRPEVGVARFRQWIETGIQPFPNSLETLDLLDKTKQETMTRKAYTKPLIETFLLDRIMGLREIERPYEPEKWGWGDQIYWLKADPIRFPNLLLHAELIYRMMRIPHRIRTFDEAWQEGLALMQCPWPQVPTQTPFMDYDVYEDYYELKHGETFRDHLQHKLTLETQLNLVRAALHLTLDPTAANQAKTLVFKNDPHNLWRDPFTERPFRVIESTTCTLIYSLGPDLQDQRGKPLDKTIRERTGLEDEHYDIGIRVPHRPPGP